MEDSILLPCIDRLDGRVVTSVLHEDDRWATEEAVRSGIRDGECQILPLVAQGDRSVGWLVSVEFHGPGSGR
jgi:hypothetical protein